MGIKSRILNIIKQLTLKAPPVADVAHPPKTVSAASATASSEPSAVRKGRRPPLPPEKINLDVAQIMGLYRGNPPWSLRKIARKLNANRGTIRARIREYEAAEKAAAKAIADREQTDRDVKARQAAAVQNAAWAAAEDAKPKDSPKTPYVPDWIPPTQPLINRPQDPPTAKPVTHSMPSPKPVPVKMPAPPTVAAAPDQPLEEGIDDWSVGFGYGSGGVRGTSPQSMPPSREAAGGLCDGGDGENGNEGK